MLVFTTGPAYASSHNLNATYIGGGEKENAADVAFDSEGNVFVVGYGASDDFLDNSIPGLTKDPFAMDDVFLFKLSSDLSEILAATYIGGNGDDNWPEVAVDSNDNVFVSGETNSSDFPTTNGAYDESYSDKGDVFIVKFNNDLTQLLSSTLMGDETDYEENWGLHIDPIDDEVFLLGETNATASTTVSYIDGTALQPTHNTKIGDDDQAPFIMKFDNTLSNKLASTFVSSNVFDENYSMKIHPDGTVFFELMTNATENDWAPAYDGKIANTFTGNPTNQLRADFPHDNQDDIDYWQSINDMLTVIKEDQNYSQTPDATARALIVDEINASTATRFENKPFERTDLIAIVEEERWTDFTKGWHLTQSKLKLPEYYGHRTNPDHLMNTDIMLTSFSNDLSTINSARYLGGSGLDAWMDFVIHDDKIYLGGETYSVDFPVTPGTLYQNHGLSCNSAGDAVDGSGYVCSNYAPSNFPYTGATERNTFVTVMDTDLSLADPIISSTYIGLSDSNDPSDIGVNPITGNIFVTGQFGENKSLENIDGAIQENIGSGTDGIIIKFNGDLTTWIQSTYIGGSGYEDNFDLYFTQDGSLYVATDTNSVDFPGTENGAQDTIGGKYDLAIAKFATTLLLEEIIEAEEEEEKKKSGGGCSGDCTPPTFYKNKSDRLIVKNGFTFNGNSTDVVDYHVPWDLISVKTNYIYQFSMKAYENGGPANFKWVQFGFGVPEIGSPISESEVLLEVKMHGDEVEETNVIEEENLVQFSNMTVNFVHCGYVDSQCLQLEGLIVFREELKNNVIAINAIDNSRNSATHYINDGILVRGQSMNAPMEYEIPSNIKYNGLQTIHRVDRVNDIWASVDEQEPVALYQKNSFGSFDALEWRVFEEIPDKISNVMIRDHSAFSSIIEREKMRALDKFDSELIQKTLPPSESIDYPEMLDRIKKIEELKNQEIMRAKVVLSEKYRYD